MFTSVIEVLKWRYATKKFDATKKLSDQQVDTLTEAARLSASSFGIQPWKFFVITNPAVREKLKAAAWGQSQVTDASHLIVFCQYAPYGQKQIDAYVADMAQTRGMDIGALNEFKKMISGSVASRTPEALQSWTARQVYISLGTVLTSAALMQIDACPMEGFDTNQFDEILGLKAFGLQSLVMCAVGFRDPSDKTAAYKKVRFAKKDVVVEIK